MMAMPVETVARPLRGSEMDTRSNHDSQDSFMEGAADANVARRLFESDFSEQKQPYVFFDSQFDLFGPPLASDGYMAPQTPEPKHSSSPPPLVPCRVLFLVWCILGILVFMLKCT